MKGKRGCKSNINQSFSPFSSFLSLFLSLLHLLVLFQQIYLTLSLPSLTSWASIFYSYSRPPFFMSIFSFLAVSSFLESSSTSHPHPSTLSFISLLTSIVFLMFLLLFLHLYTLSIFLRLVHIYFHPLKSCTGASVFSSPSHNFYSQFFFVF